MTKPPIDRVSKWDQMRPQYPTSWTRDVVRRVNGTKIWEFLLTITANGESSEVDRAMSHQAPGVEGREDCEDDGSDDSGGE